MYVFTKLFLFSVLQDELEMAQECQEGSHTMQCAMSLPIHTPDFTWVYTCNNVITMNKGYWERNQGTTLFQSRLSIMPVTSGVADPPTTIQPGMQHDYFGAKSDTHRLSPLTRNCFLVMEAKMYELSMYEFYDLEKWRWMEDGRRFRE